MRKTLLSLTSTYLVISGLILNALIVIALFGNTVIIETPVWWLCFLRSIGFMVESTTGVILVCK